MSVPTRRQFLAASALTLTAATYNGAAEKANDRIRVALMGTRIRGKQLLPVFLKQPNVEVAYIIEPDENLLPAAVALTKDQATAPKTEKDVRKALEDPSVTALIVAAPDYWHALATVWACQAGKHVYCEKPVSHNLIEGRRMVQAARKYKRVVQVGTQRRSNTAVASAREYIQSGKLGKVAFARAWIAGKRPNIGKAESAPVPQGVDYSLYLGPVAEGPFTKNRFHYNWHWFWDMGTGEIGNNGIHGLDVVRNILDLDAPTRVTCSGGKYIHADDDQQTPDTQIATYDFAKGPGGAAGCTVLWEHRVWEKNGPEGQSFGVIVHGDKGTLIFKGSGWEVRDGDGASDKAQGDMVGAHVGNFLDCIRDSSKTPNADIEVGHASTRLCHLGNIAYRTGRVLHFDAATETFKNDAEANKLLGREYRKGFELPTI